MFALNNKQREEFAKSLMKIAEYIILTMVVSQLALGRINLYMSFPAVIMAALIYILSLNVLEGYEEVN